MPSLGSKKALVLLGVSVLALCVALPQVSFAGKKHAHSAKTKKRAASCSGTLLPASPSVRPLGHLYVSGKACVKGTVKLQQALDGSWSGLGKTTANRNGSFSTCVALRDAAGSPSVQLRAVASNGSKAFATVQVSDQGTDSCSSAPTPAEPQTTTTTPPPTDPPPTDPPPPPTYTLTVSTSGAGTVGATGISCPGDCTESYASGTPVTLTATPTSGNSFSGWGGACSGSATTCTVTMSEARSVSAGFAADPPPSYALTVSVSGQGSVTATGISCPGDCSQSYASGTPVTLTATPTSGNSFSGWGGACSGTLTTCTVTMSGAKSANASFAATPPPSEIPPGLALLKEDLATNPDPMKLWGDIDAVSPDRHQWFASGGPDGGPFRRMTAKDGDLYHGDSERAELGNSNYQLNSDGSLKTFFLYKEGQRRVTSYWMRLPSDFPLYDYEHWQVVMQMKQSEPASNADGTPVIALQAIEGNWILKQSSSSGLSESTRYIWTTPADNALGNWTHIVVDATYSTDPSKGLFQITIGGVASPVFHMYDLKKEISPAGPGLSVGSSIPSHLRLGIYHDPVMPGTHVDIADVQVFG